jgi:hypothetical protein
MMLYLYIGGFVALMVVALCLEIRSMRRSLCRLGFHSESRQYFSGKGYCKWCGASTDLC